MRSAHTYGGTLGYTRTVRRWRTRELLAPVTRDIQPIRIYLDVRVLRI